MNVNADWTISDQSSSGRGIVRQDTSADPPPHFPRFPKLRATPDGVLKISPLVKFEAPRTTSPRCDDATPAAALSPEPQARWADGRGFSSDPLLLVAAACTAFWVAFWVWVLA